MPTSLTDFLESRKKPLLQRLAQAGRTALRTCKWSRAELITDGRHVWRLDRASANLRRGPALCAVGDLAWRDLALAGEKIYFFKEGVCWCLIKPTFTTRRLPSGEVRHYQRWAAWAWPRSKGRAVTLSLRDLYKMQPDELLTKMREMRERIDQYTAKIDAERLRRARVRKRGKRGKLRAGKAHVSQVSGQVSSGAV